MKSVKILLTLLIFLLTAYSAMSEPITVVTLGDSLTQGDGDDRGGYPARLLDMLKASHSGSTVKNLGQSGWTSDDLINTQLQPTITILNQAKGSKSALVWIGSNDLFGLYNYVCDNDYQNDFNRCESDGLEIFSKNIEKILTSLKATGAKLYIAILDDQSKRPVMTDSQLRMNSYDKITDTDVKKMSAQTTKYNDIIKKTAKNYGATLVDFYNTTIFEDKATLSDDGNHPNASGYDKIAEIWYKAIIK